MLKKAPNVAKMRTSSCSGLTALDLHQLRKDHFTVEVSEEELSSWNAIQELLFSYFPYVGEGKDKYDVVRRFHARRDPDLLSRCAEAIVRECLGKGSYHSTPQADPTMPASNQYMLGSEITNGKKAPSPPRNISLVTSNVTPAQKKSFDDIEARRSSSDNLPQSPLSYQYETDSSSRIFNTFSSSTNEHAFSSNTHDESDLTVAERNGVGNPSSHSVFPSHSGASRGIRHLHDATLVTVVAPSYETHSSPEETLSSPSMSSNATSCQFSIHGPGGDMVALSDVVCRLWIFFTTFSDPDNPKDMYADQVSLILDELPPEVVRDLANMPVTSSASSFRSNKGGCDSRASLQADAKCEQQQRNTVIDCANAMLKFIIHSKMQ